MKRISQILFFLLWVQGINYLHAGNRDQEPPSVVPDQCTGIRVLHAPANPSVAFAGFNEVANIPVTSFVAQCSRLKEVYIWIHEELSGSVGAHIIQEGLYGKVIAIGSVSGKEKGRQRIIFPNDIYLEKGETYYLKLFKGEPATVYGSVARAAQNADDVQGYNLYDPVAYDLAHELLFDKWEGTPPENKQFEGKKKHFEGYEQRVNAALNSKMDVWGEQVLALPEGPTYENIKDYLAPLKLMGTAVTESGVYYIPFGRPLNPSGFGPAALHVGDGSQIVSQVHSGDKITIFVGASGNERYGFAEARLAQESLEDGYYPVLQNQYRDVDGVKYFQESFSDYLFATTELVSFIKLKVSKGESDINSVKVTFHFSDNNLLALENNIIKSNNEIRAIISPGGRLIESNRVVYDLDLSKGDTELYIARLLHPANCTQTEITAALYNAEKKELKDYWDGELAKGATFDIPEEQVNNARKNLLIQNLYMGYLYSIGNIYQTWYQPEGNDAARVLGEYGFIQRQKAIHEILLSRPFRRYRTWEMGELLSHASQYFYMSRDTAFISENKARFIDFLSDFETQINNSGNSVLTAESFSGDIAEKMVYLHHQAVAWRGMRDMAYIFKASLGDTKNGDKFLFLAGQLKTRLSEGVNNSKTALPDGSVFIPTELFTQEKPLPYSNITDTKYGSYWNLCFPYVAASGLLDQGLMPGYYQYLKDYGAFLLGMVRFNYYPLPVGSYKEDGLPGYKTPGVDNVYGLNLSRVTAMMDDPDRLVLSFYAKLAHGMTRGTFISGEGDTVGPFPNEYYRTFYLSPSSFNNTWFLLMLRLMLITETDAENGVPDKLQLAYFTPRAWLEQGKRINVSNAPTLFGKIDYQICSDIDKGTVHVTLSMPDQAGSASEVSLRLRTPGNKKIKKVKINGEKHKAFDVENETIDLTGKTGQLQLSVHY
ncbi:hypothetical protein [uncultured Proteiniphilum sp.]|uniref:hypothetical protein n=1 Tax=uncultured Proteiniphilum sp. TaxID=497637 RepID=UPI0026029535|nr:hypothetical protein [uncultured Proteiniphilum sp.]